ncbi:MAG: hypothetical protein ACOC8F_02890, partial [Planctomycetota bacterium]
MARRKRLNKRLILLLGAFGGILVAGVLVLVLGGLPADAAAAAAEGIKAYEAAQASIEQGEYEKAKSQLVKALKSYKRAADADEDNADYMYQLAVIRRALAERIPAPTMTQTERQEYGGRYESALRKALRRDPNHREARAALVELAWMRARNSDTGWAEFVTEAGKLLELQQDAETYFRRGYAHRRLLAM